MHLRLRSLVSIKNPGEVRVPVEHDTADLLIRQDTFDAEILQSAVRDAQHLPDVGAS